MNSLSDSPKIRGWMTNRELNFRAKAPALLESAIKTGYLFGHRYREFKISYFQLGVASVVAKVSLTQENEVYIVKTSRKPQLLANQTFLLNLMERQGVSTPHVLSMKMPNDDYSIPFQVLEDVSSPLLSQTTTDVDRIKSGVAFKMGQVLKLGHVGRYKGFGNPKLVDNKVIGESDSLQMQLEREIFTKRIGRLLVKGFLDHLYVHNVLIALKYVLKNQKKVAKTICNYDYSPNNIFLKDGDLIVFDPKPKVTLEIFDLAHTCVNSFCYSEGNSWEEAREILKGYLDKSDAKLSMAMLKHGLILMSVYKMYSLYYKGNEKRAMKIRDAFIRSKWNPLNL